MATESGTIIRKNKQENFGKNKLATESDTIIRKNKQENFGKNKLANIQDKNDKRCPVESCGGFLGPHGIRNGIKRFQCKKCKD